MKLVKFKGPMGLPAQSARHLDQATLERLGVSVPESSLTNGNLVFGPMTNHTIEMSNEASDSLVAALPNEFEIVEGNEDEDDELATPLTTSTPPQDSVENDDNDENADDEDSSDDD